jgi:uncharacterized protein YbjT (DUF2867 family)
MQYFTHANLNSFICKVFTMTTGRKQETILLTGASGTVGSEVVKQLLRDNSDVHIKAAVHSIENIKKVKDENRIESVQIDYKKPETLATALKGVDKLFLVTPETLNAPELVSNLVTEAKKAGIRYIVRLSAMGESSIASVRLHLQGEKVIEESGIPFTILRPNTFMQFFVNFYGPTIKNNNTFYGSVEDAKVSFIDIRDIAAIVVKTLTDDKHNGKVYTITGPEALSQYQVAEILSNATTKKINYVDIPEEEFQRRKKEIGLNDWWVNLMIEAFYSFREGYHSRVSSTVEEVTGKKPISFSKFAKDYSQAFK